MAKKPVLTAAEAAKMIPDGATVMCGGFLACGQARAIVKELVKLGTKDLTLIANDMGRAVGPKGEEFFGIAELIHNHQVKRIIATHVGMTPEVGQQNTEGTLEVNLLPQGTLAECIRAGGAGLGGVSDPPPRLGDFDCLVCNPPYIPSGDIAGLDVSVRDYEPHLALDGGTDGLDFYRSVCRRWRDVLHTGSRLAFEVGIGQADDVLRLMRGEGFGELEILPDPAGIPRVVTGLRYREVYADA